MSEDAKKLDSQPDSVARSGAAPKQDWREQVRLAFREPGPLLSFLGLDATGEMLRPASSFPMLVPRAFAKRMVRGDRNDPLLLQTLPDPDETSIQAGFGSDPVGDLDSRSAPAILHKYHGRALLMTTGACAVHCRYCFRQHFPYAGETANGQRWAQALRYLAEHDEIQEIILSGGDPLMLPTRRLRDLTRELQGLQHLRRLRIHTRLPLILPDRVTDDLLHWLRRLPWPVVMVVHANHPQEFDADVDRALSRLKTAGVQLLNQAVLLRGINDSTSTLRSLMERGFAGGVLPYYLHQLDRVAGSARFEVSEARAKQLVARLREQLSGYLVPRLVTEQPGQPYKLPLL